MKANAVKRLGMVRRKKSMTHEQFVTHWLTVHAELCKKLPGMRRYSAPEGQHDDTVMALAFAWAGLVAPRQEALIADGSAYQISPV